MRNSILPVALFLTRICQKSKLEANCWSPKIFRSKLFSPYACVRNVHTMSEEPKKEQTEEEETIFGKIIKGDVPCKKVYEDEKCLAFHDISPQAPVHIVLIPKSRDGLTQLSKAEEKNKDILGHLMLAVAKIAKQEKIEGFRVVINDGESACQSVFHLHLHILGGRRLNWPPG